MCEIKKVEENSISHMHTFNLVATPELLQCDASLVRDRFLSRWHITLCRRWVGNRSRHDHVIDNNMSHHYLLLAKRIKKFDSSHNAYSRGCK